MFGTTPIDVARTRFTQKVSDVHIATDNILLGASRNVESEVSKISKIVGRSVKMAGRFAYPVMYNAEKNLLMNKINIGDRARENQQYIIIMSGKLI